MFKKALIALGILHCSFANATDWEVPPYWSFTYVIDRFDEITYNEPDTPIGQWGQPSLKADAQVTLRFTGFKYSEDGPWDNYFFWTTGDINVGFDPYFGYGSVQVISQDENGIPTDWSFYMGYSAGSPHGGYSYSLGSTPAGTSYSYSTYYPSGGDPYYKTTQLFAFASTGTWSVEYVPGIVRVPEVPEPSSYALMLAGLAFLSVASRKRA